MQLTTIIGWLTVALAGAAHGRRLTREEKLTLLHAANEADKDTKFINFEEIQGAIDQTPILLLTYSAHWCHQSQRFGPKFLTVQKQVDAAELHRYGFRMAKVECAADHEAYCHKQRAIAGFPTTLLYIKGKLVEEYPEADEPEPLFRYIVNNVRQFGVKPAEPAGEGKQGNHTVGLPLMAPPQPEDETPVIKDKGTEADMAEDEAGLWDVDKTAVSSGALHLHLGSSVCPHERDEQD
ncbi:hypothetical protein BC831DRAFT_459206 [Entophlyctis helioformis]|nr:hypothetical protein BC831DRAFT_459206 [Entophlyctis helioformis]